MATAGTEADNLSGKNIQGTVVVSGQISPETGLRAVLEELLEECRHVQHGVLRVLSKDVRGHIGVFCGSYIAGAHVTTTRDYGVKALKQLLTASRGMYAFLSLPDQQIELKQSLSLSIDELLNWQPHGASPEENASFLVDAVEQLVSHSGRFDAISDTDLGDIQTEILLGARKAEESDSSFLAWGGDMPVLASNLARLKLSPKTVHTGELPPMVTVERIPIPDDLDELAKATILASQAADEALQLPAIDNDTHFVGSGGGERPQPQAQLPVWTSADLDAIPTPNRSDAFMPLPEQNQMAQEVQRSLRLGSFNRSLDQRQRASASASQGIQNNYDLPAPALTSGRYNTRDDVALSSLVSQRMPTLDPKAFISESGAKSAAPPPPPPNTKLWVTGAGVASLVVLVFLCHHFFQVSTATKHFQDGLTALKNNRLEQVVSEMTQVVNAQPDSAQGFFYRASAEARLGQPKKAFADYTRTIELEPKNVLAYAGRAAVRISTKDYDGAISDCEIVQKLKADFMEAYRLRALALSNNGDYKGTIEDASFYLDATDGREKSSGRADMLSTRAFAYFNQKDYTHAVKDYNEAILLNSKQADLYLSRAACYRELHNWRRALTDANRAAHFDPTNAVVFQIRGACYKAQGDMTKALAEFEKAVKLKPSAVSHRLRGEARLATRDYNGAIEDFDIVLSTEPNNKDVRSLSDQAHTQIKSTIKAPSGGGDVSLSGTPEQLLQRGTKLLNNGSTSEAVEVLTAAVKAAPSNVSARRYLAYALAADGNDDEAVGQFGALAQAGALQGADKVAYGKALIGANKLESAIALLSPIVTSEPGNDAARMALIKAYVAAGFQDRAGALAAEGAAQSPQRKAAYAAMLKGQ